MALVKGKTTTLSTKDQRKQRAVFFPSLYLAREARIETPPCQKTQAEGQAKQKLTETVPFSYFTMLPGASLLVTQVMHLPIGSLSLILIISTCQSHFRWFPAHFFWFLEVIYVHAHIKTRHDNVFSVKIR